MNIEAAKILVSELQHQLNDAKIKGIKELRKNASQELQRGDPMLALQLTALAKSLHCPCPSLDFIRAMAFLAINDKDSAREALKEELRFYPDNIQAKEILNTLVQPVSKRFSEDTTFQMLYDEVAPYSMVSVERMYNLYKHAIQTCHKGLEGHFVECGVAGGGTSGLLAAVLKRMGQTQRKLFCCDSFEGMPPASEHDVHQGVHAETTGWGNGTCSSPESSVLSLCKKLDAAELPTIVKGYFCDTLPLWKTQMTPIAFLHMDGDWYSSTHDILINLYDCLVPGAFVQIDDYGHWEGCSKAVHEFAENRGINFELTPIDNTGVYFIKK